MPNSRTLKRSFSVFHLGFSSASSATQLGNSIAATALWNMASTSSLMSYHKLAAATVSVINIPIPHGPRGGLPTNEDASINIIEVFYAVTTANLTSAPTATLNRQTYPGGAGTGFAATTTVAQTLTFAGVDSVGTASGAGATGSHIAVVTVTTVTPYADTDSYVLSLTMNEAATSVLDIFGITVTYV